MSVKFSKWSGDNGIEQYIIERTGCKPYSGAGINPRVEKNTTILRSVDDTYFYDDDLSNVNDVKYTLFGHNGDQDEFEKKFNEPLINPDKTKNIYLYRVKLDGKKREYIWYGKYIIYNKKTKSHIGKDQKMRKIILLSLRKIED
jgi:hypothetical protein